MPFISRKFCQLLLSVFFRFRITGPLPTCDKPVILAGNHSGFLDGLIIVAAFPHNFRFMIKEEVLSWPYVGKVVARINPVIVREGREIAAIREAVKTLQRGESLCIFPEGKLSRDGELADFKAGVAMIQKLSGAAIVPFTLKGSFEAWGWGQTQPQLFTPISICFATPILAGENTSTSTSVTELLKKSVKAGLSA